MLPRSEARPTGSKEPFLLPRAAKEMSQPSVSGQTCSSFLGGNTKEPLLPQFPVTKPGALSVSRLAGGWRTDWLSGLALLCGKEVLYSGQEAACDKPPPHFPAKFLLPRQPSVRLVLATHSSTGQ